MVILHLHIIAGFLSDCVVRVNRERLKRDGYDVEFVDELAELAENITSFSDDEEE